MVFNVEFAVSAVPKILEGLPVTLLLTVVGMVLSTLLGLLVCLCRMYKVPFFGKLVSVYLNIIRGVPLMVQLYFVFVALPIWIQSLVDTLGMDTYVIIPPFAVAAVALVCNYTAYMSEVIRSALMSVDAGQMEAAHSVGMTSVEAMRRVIIPQAVVVALPNVGNTFIGMVKDTSLAYMVMVMDVMGEAKTVAGSGLNFLEAYTIAALLYWGLNLILERVFAVLEKRANHFNCNGMAAAK